MPNSKNVAQVAEIKERLQDSSAMWVVDYRGLNVKQIQELRRSLREAQAEMKVYKNTLTKIALSELDMPAMDEYLEGPNGFVYVSGSDVAASAKVLKKFAEDNPDLEIRAGILEGQVLDAAGVKEVADLPSRDQLIAMFLMVVSSPATQFVRVLNEPMASFARTLGAIASQKEAA